MVDAALPKIEVVEIDDNPAIQLEVVHQDFERGSDLSYDFLYGVKLIRRKMLEGGNLDFVKELITNNDMTEMGEAVIPSIVSRVILSFDEDSGKFTQSGFDLLDMLENGVTVSEGSVGLKAFEHKRRLAELNNFQNKIIPGAKNILDGKAQFLELSPYPLGVDEAAASSLGYNPESKGGVIRMYRKVQEAENKVELVQIQVPTDYFQYLQLAEQYGLTEGIDEETFLETEVDGSGILDISGFIEPGVNLYDLLKVYFEGSKGDIFINGQEMENFYKIIRPLAQEISEEMFESQVNIAMRTLPGITLEDYLDEVQAERELKLRKLEFWQKFAQRINPHASIVVAFDYGDDIVNVEIESSGMVWVCGTGMEISAGEIVDKAESFVRLVGMRITEDEKGSLAFTCSVCGAIVIRSPLTGEMVSFCPLCQNPIKSCTKDEQERSGDTKNEDRDPEKD